MILLLKHASCESPRTLIARRQEKIRPFRAHNSYLTDSSRVASNWSLVGLFWSPGNCSDTIYDRDNGSHFLTLYAALITPKSDYETKYPFLTSDCVTDAVRFSTCKIPFPIFIFHRFPQQTNYQRSKNEHDKGASKVDPNNDARGP